MTVSDSAEVVTNLAREGLAREIPSRAATSKDTAAQVMIEDMKENLWGYAKRLRFVRKAIVTELGNDSTASVRILDVGCGNGSFLAIPLAQSGYEVVGIDLHQPSIERAVRFAGGIPNARFYVRSVSGLEGPAFNVVILSEVLEHVSNPKELLMDSLGHLTSNGIVVVTVPNGYGEFEIDSWIYRNLRLQYGVKVMKQVLRRVQSFPSGTQPQENLAATDNLDCGHVQFFRRRVLKKLFSECSLAIAAESAGAFVCGPLVCYTLARSQRFIDWNVRIADKLPLALASSWYFVLRRIPRNALP